MQPTSSGGSLWQQAEQLIAASEIVIDRPAGLPHPRIPEAVYPLDYGYLAGTTGGDGDGVDVFVGTAPDDCVSGVVCTIDLHKRDAELKLLLRCTDAEITAIEEFYAPLTIAALVIRRESDAKSAGHPQSSATTPPA